MRGEIAARQKIDLAMILDMDEGVGILDARFKAVRRRVGCSAAVGVCDELSR